ncbi:protein of unknown function [Shinella sp. WSC3-e]|nr:hypothetical protein SHINE37_41650 [Rhizobiaceae bacterium]CAK7256270.1 protein of unknown function [Shinella sp. WSC3-e]
MPCKSVIPFPRNEKAANLLAAQTDWQSPEPLSSVMLGLDPSIHKPLRRLDPRLKAEDDGGGWQGLPAI